MGRTPRTAPNPSLTRALIRAAVLAAFAVVAVGGADAASRIDVGVSQSLRVPVRGAITNVVVSNPAVADVTVVDGHSVIVIGKGSGISQIMVFDSVGRVLLDDIVNVSAPQDGLVTFYRGGTPQQMRCSPACDEPPRMANAGDFWSSAIEKLSQRSNRAGSAESGAPYAGAP